MGFLFGNPKSTSYRCSRWHTPLIAGGDSKRAMRVHMEDAF